MNKFIDYLDKLSWSIVKVLAIVLFFIFFYHFLVL